jgi:hypothetical protein
MRGIGREEQGYTLLNIRFRMGVNKIFSILTVCHIHLKMKDYVFTLATATSTLAKNEMNSIINKLTLWTQDTSVDVVMC